MSTPIATTGIGARDEREPETAGEMEDRKPEKAPSMKNEPCARLTTFISPKISDRPAAIRNSKTP